MSVLVIPNVLVNGTGPANLVDATGLNANFNAIATAVNNIYPSQILPLTSGQATFGATATGVGYKFLANDATATPLTVAGVTSQSADIFDVTLTSGGTKAFYVSLNGAAGFGPNNLGGQPGDLTVGRSGAATGLLAFGGATHSGSLDYGVTIGQQFSLFSSATTGQLNLGAGGTYGNGTVWLPTAISGNFSGLTTGNGGSQTVNTILGTALCLVNSSVAAYIAVDVSGNLGIAGTLHQTSKREMKQRIEYVDPNEALQVVLATKIARYDFITEDAADQPRHASFIADEAPWQLTGGPGQEYADPQKTASYALAAIAALHDRVVALEAHG